MIISDNLFKRVLTTPMCLGANQLCIVSGYATAAMAFHHMQSTRKKQLDVNVHLLVGMCPHDGMSISNHRGFKQLVEEDFTDSFQCSYIKNPPAVHSKLYVWLKNDTPFVGFTGSANYTQTAFSQNRREIMTECDPISAFKYYQSLLGDSIYCAHNDVDGLIELHEDRREKQRAHTVENLPAHLIGLEKVTISLLAREGVVPIRSGLNWGQREGRDPNQAYIALRADVYSTDFFPEIRVHFTVLTDDGKTIICSRAQQQAKGIHTPHNNALLGEYFRNRLGLRSGEMVTKDHLNEYGRTDIEFYKIDNETYYMNFSA